MNKERREDILGVARCISFLGLKADDVTMEQAVVWHGRELNITMTEALDALNVERDGLNSRLVGLLYTMLDVRLDEEEEMEEEKKDGKAA